MADLHFVQETAVRWEYRLQAIEQGRLDWSYEAINRLGAEGWEAVAYTGQDILFKRPLPADGRDDG